MLKKWNFSNFLVCLAFIFLSSTLYAEALIVEVFNNDGASLGLITFEDHKYGLLIKPELKGLEEGLHGFHIHEHPNCSDKGMNAGGHLDPAKTNSHKGPYEDGHLGDLPVLVVNSKGQADLLMLAPRLKLKDIKGHAIMIHAGADNYSDVPPLGGGGARIGCGKIPKS